MAKNYVVTAPYVTLHVTDDTGADVVLGFYKGAVVPDSVTDESLQNHVDKGLVAEEGTAEAAKAAPVGPEPTDEQATKAAKSTSSSKSDK